MSISQPKLNKFCIDEKLYCFNIGMQSPLIKEFVVKGIVSNDDGLFYSQDKNAWIKEEYLYKDRKAAYKYMIQQAENEMNQPENIQK